MQHACKVIIPGRSFLRRVIALLSVAKKRHHHIRLNNEFKADLAWWNVFAMHWNGASLLVSKESVQITLTSDASGRNSRYANDDTLMRMLRCLFFVEAHFQFSLAATHIPGIHNVLADDLSRNRLPSFFSQIPDANRTPSFLPPSLLQWLRHPKWDWTSPSWTVLFSSSVLRA